MKYPTPSHISPNILKNNKPGIVNRTPPTDPPPTMKPRGARSSRPRSKQQSPSKTRSGRRWRRGSRNASKESPKETVTVDVTVVDGEIQLPEQVEEEVVPRQTRISIKTLSNEEPTVEKKESKDTKDAKETKGGEETEKVEASDRGVETTEEKPESDKKDQDFLWETQVFLMRTRTRMDEVAEATQNSVQETFEVTKGKVELLLEDFFSEEQQQARSAMASQVSETINTSVLSCNDQVDSVLVRFFDEEEEGTPNTSNVKRKVLSDESVSERKYSVHPTFTEETPSVVSRDVYTVNDSATEESTSVVSRDLYAVNATGTEDTSIVATESTPFNDAKSEDALETVSESTPTTGNFLGGFSGWAWDDQGNEKFGLSSSPTTEEESENSVFLVPLENRKKAESLVGPSESDALDEAESETAMEGERQDTESVPAKQAENQDREAVGADETTNSDPPASTRSVNVDMADPAPSGTKEQDQGLQNLGSGTTDGAVADGDEKVAKKDAADANNTGSGTDPVDGSKEKDVDATQVVHQIITAITRSFSIPAPSNSSKAHKKQTEVPEEKKSAVADPAPVVAQRAAADASSAAEAPSLPVISPSGLAVSPDEAPEIVETTTDESVTKFKEALYKHIVKDMNQATNYCEDVSEAYSQSLSYCEAEIPGGDRALKESDSSSPPALKEEGSSSSRRASSTNDDKIVPSSDDVPQSSDKIENKYVPPSSRNVPPSSKYVPPSSKYVPLSKRNVPPSSKYIPQSSTYVPPSSKYAPQSRKYVPTSSKSVLSSNSNYVPSRDRPVSTSPFLINNSVNRQPRESTKKVMQADSVIDLSDVHIHRDRRNDEVIELPMGPLPQSSPASPSSPSRHQYTASEEPTFHVRDGLVKDKQRAFKSSTSDREVPIYKRQSREHNGIESEFRDDNVDGRVRTVGNPKKPIDLTMYEELD